MKRTLQTSHYLKLKQELMLPTHIAHCSKLVNTYSNTISGLLPNNKMLKHYIALQLQAKGLKTAFQAKHKT